MCDIAMVLKGEGPFQSHIFRNVRQTSSDAVVVQDHLNIAYLGQTVGQTHSHMCDIAMVLKGEGPL